MSLEGDVSLPPPGAKEATTASIGKIKANGGEIALCSGREFGNPDAIVDYVEWGNSGRGRSRMFVGAGMWNPDNFVSTTGGTVFHFTDSMPTNGAEDWTAG